MQVCCSSFLAGRCDFGPAARCVSNAPHWQSHLPTGDGAITEIVQVSQPGQTAKNELGEDEAKKTKNAQNLAWKHLGTGLTLAKCSVQGGNFNMKMIPTLAKEVLKKAKSIPKCMFSPHGFNIFYQLKFNPNGYHPLAPMLPRV